MFPPLGCYPATPRLRPSESQKLKQFSDLGLADPIMEAIAIEGYENPTPIQAGVIPVLLEGRDVMGIAQTGTGKTAAFVLPALNSFVGEQKRPRPGRCRVLVLTPTRELAAQIARNIRAYGQCMRNSVVVVVGGADMRNQKRALSRGADIVVATPGRLLDHMSSGSIHLDETRMVVLDEGDQMLDYGFMPDIRRIMEQVPTRRQTAFFSATMPPQMKKLANDFLTDPEEVAVAQQSRPVERIEQRVVFIEKGDKRQHLVSMLKDLKMDRCIIFTRTRRGADNVERTLSRADFNAAALHGDKSQRQRERALATFRNGRTPILVATDIAARGIDVDGISHVVNFELPNVPEAYVHRIGRTARAGRAGVAISFCDSSERDYLRDIQKLIGAEIRGTDADGNKVELGVRPSSKRKKGGGGRGRPGHGHADGRGSRSGGRGNAGRKSPARQRTHAERDDAGSVTDTRYLEGVGEAGGTARSGKPAPKARGRKPSRPGAGEGPQRKPRASGPGGKGTKGGKTANGPKGPRKPSRNAGKGGEQGRRRRPAS